MCMLYDSYCHLCSMVDAGCSCILSWTCRNLCRKVHLIWPYFKSDVCTYILSVHAWIVHWPLNMMLDAECKWVHPRHWKVHMLILKWSYLNVMHAHTLIHLDVLEYILASVQYNRYWVLTTFLCPPLGSRPTLARFRPTLGSPLSPP